MLLIAFRHSDAASIFPYFAHALEEARLPVIGRPMLLIAKVQALGLLVPPCEDVGRDSFAAIITS